jgi:Flp pilus assembly protein TadB
MSATFEPRSPRGGTDVLILRLVIAALVAALGVALWVSGHVLIGGLILALAVVRLVLFFTMRRRRNQWRQRRGGIPGHLGPPPSPDAPLPYEPPV